MTSPLPPHWTLRGETADAILGYYQGLRETEPGYVGYSETTLKQVIAKTALQLPATRIVDLGSGPNPVVLFQIHSARSAVELTAVELSADFCDHARANASKLGIPLTVVNASVHETGLAEGSFDLAILAETLEHIPDELERPTLEEARSLLSPGGHLIVSVPNADSLFERYTTWRRGFVEEHPLHLREYTVRRLAASIDAAGFEVVRHLAVPPPPAGRVARLMSAVPVPARWSLKAALVARVP
jgi:2-polyprenyl-3-methyl-5-hydroxy-6-metoxy-1,4-benzoquinol methylase